MSKTLIKILDEAVFPAALLIAAKILGIVVLNVGFKLDWSVTSVANSFFSTRIEYSGSDAVMVASYSNLLMYIAVFAGVAIILSKMFYLNPNHATPQLVLKLARADMLHWIRSAFELYHQAFVWFLFLVITTIFIFLNYLNGDTYDWIAWVVLVITIFTLWILIKVVDRDLHHDVQNK